MGTNREVLKDEALTKTDNNTEYVKDINGNLIEVRDPNEISIDDVIKTFNESLHNPYGCPVVGQDNAMKLAISIMHKYEKIKQIVNRPIGDNAEEKAYNYMMIVKDIKDVTDTKESTNERV